MIILTDSVGHAVKEEPCVCVKVSSEADVVTGLNADHREEVQLVDIIIAVQCRLWLVLFSLILLVGQWTASDTVIHIATGSILIHTLGTLVLRRLSTEHTSFTWREVRVSSRIKSLRGKVYAGRKMFGHSHIC